MKTHKYEDIDFSAEPWAGYLWGGKRQANLRREIDQAIEEQTEHMEKPEGTLKIIAYLRSEIGEDEIRRCARLALERLWEELEEDYGDPNAIADQKPDDADKAATFEWVKEIVSGFQVWTCDETDQVVEVDVRKWAELRAPHWLEEGP